MPELELETVIYEVEEPVATISLNRPAALNAWTHQMGIDLRAAFTAAHHDPRVVGIILTGAGRGFCAGADMNLLGGLSGADGEQEGVEIHREPPPGDPDWPADLRNEYTYFLSIPKPVICVINGAVAGMGLPVALACDIRFMSDDAVITTSYSHRGLIAEYGVATFLSRLVGPAKALDLLFTSRKVKGPEAEQLGLVNKSCPADEVLDYAKAYIRGLAEQASPTSMAVMKRQLYSELYKGFEQISRDAEKEMLASFVRPDFVEGVTAYREKRAPSFGRIGDAG